MAHDQHRNATFLVLNNVTGAATGLLFFLFSGFGALS